jgi:sec-independent protein translocase protein TatB
MFDMSWGEIMVIGAVALIVIGPKDLPKALRTLGNMTAKVRRMASEFQSQFNDAMREAELDDIKQQVEGLNRSVSSATSAAFDPVQTIRDELKGSIERPVTADSSLPGSSPAADAPAASVDLPVPPVAEPALSAALAAEPAGDRVPEPAIAAPEKIESPRV